MSTTERVSKNDLIDRAEEVARQVGERADETEKLRRIPEENLRALEEAGLTRVVNPERFGGYPGIDYDTFFEVGQRIAAGCGSTGWCYSVAMVHNWHVGLAPEKMQEEYYASPLVWSSSAFNPSRAKAEPADGGWTVSGRWDFSSGVDHAEWAFLGAVVPVQPTPDYRLLMIPRSDFEIVDDWFASGLEGTGSKSIVIDEPVFVPAHRYLPMHDTETSEARRVHNRATYGLPIGAFLPTTLVTPVVGMAQGMLDSFEDRMITRVTAFGGQEMKGLVNIQLRLAESAADLDAARELLRRDLRELIEKAARGEQLTVGDRVRLRRDHAYGSMVATRVAQRLFDASGGHALFRSSPLQRFHRDINAGSHQVVLGWDEQAESYGRHRLGLEPNGFMW
ncbi:MAG: acyl-CoA dehydrogenase family protein [Solirubrobacterales bacterium]|nr:acyl-CoA dehydrogenase family protein [Solirubrobacterales bacterium]